MSIPEIDLVVLTRDERPLLAPIRTAIKSQQGVRLRLHRVVGAPRPDDPHRVATIARARNEAVSRATSPFLMFVDDDVRLASDCVARLHHALAGRPEYAAFAADYLGQIRNSRSRTAPHVAMGATLIRTSVFRHIRFRWEAAQCECTCFCRDCRSLGLRVDYLAGATATHLPSEPSAEHDESCPAEQLGSPVESERPPRVLAAFNRRDVGRFRDAFLKTLRASGYRGGVTAVGYGLYPSEANRLRALPGVDVVAMPENGQMPPVRRLSDFGQIVATLDPMTPVAYWDASDVLFQGSLDPLWRLVRQHSDKLLAVREPRGYPGNAAIVGWTHSIRSPDMRRRAFELFSTRPFLNSGFGAGTAAAMKTYFETAAALRTSEQLRGTTDWGDQTAMNLYCHSDNSRWQEISECWNYCVHDRPFGEVHVAADGRVISQKTDNICVVHGNARSMAQKALVY